MAPSLEDSVKGSANTHGSSVVKCTSGIQTLSKSLMSVADDLLLPSKKIHIVYDKSVENTDSALDLGTVLRKLGFTVAEYYVFSEQVYKLPEMIPKEDIVFVHMDPEEKLPVGSLLKPTRFIEEQFPYTWGFPYEFSENCLWKSFMNQIFASHNIPHCKTVCIERVTEENRHALEAQIDKQLKGPLFVKIDAGMNSEGLSAENLAPSGHSALQVAARLLEANAGGVVIQEYLPGREFTVAVYAGGDGMAHLKAQGHGRAHVMHPIERHFEEGELYSPPDGTRSESALDAGDEARLIEECRELARRAFEAINTSGAACYGRVDLRCDSSGRVRVLEVNDTCGFGPNSYFAMSCAAAGQTREGVLTELLCQQARRWGEAKAGAKIAAAARAGAVVAAVGSNCTAEAVSDANLRMQTVATVMLTKGGS